MSVAKVIEFSSSSKKGVEDAVQSGLRKVAETVKNIQGAWVSETKVINRRFRKHHGMAVNLRVTFIVE